MLKLFNTLTRSVDEFKPIKPPAVSLYTCGPTVYNFAHIGNFRTFIFEDVLRRWLEASGFDVFHVMNLTDVDDKTIRGAHAAGVSLDDGLITVRTNYFGAFSRAVAGVARRESIRLHELLPTDESLESVFSYLVRQ